MGKDGVCDAAERGAWHGHLEAELGAPHAARRAVKCVAEEVQGVLDVDGRGHLGGEIAHENRVAQVAAGLVRVETVVIARPSRVERLGRSGSRHGDHPVGLPLQIGFLLFLVGRRLKEGNRGLRAKLVFVTVPAAYARWFDGEPGPPRGGLRGKNPQRALCGRTQAKMSLRLRPSRRRGGRAKGARAGRMWGSARGQRDCPVRSGPRFGRGRAHQARSLRRRP